MSDVLTAQGSDRLGRRHWIAVGVALAAMLLAVVGPTWVRFTGDREYLAVEPVDPRSLFRGNYVDLNYSVPEHLLPASVGWGDGVYVIFAKGRPARPIQVVLDRPKPDSGTFCLEGEYRSGIRFDTLEQYFVPQDQAKELERDLSSQLAEIAVTNGCRAILIGLQPR